MPREASRLISKSITRAPTRFGSQGLLVPSLCRQWAFLYNRVQPCKKALSTFLRSLVPETAVRTYPVVLPPPDLRLHLGLGKRVKHLHVQKFIPDFGVETFNKAILPWFPRFYMDGVRTVLDQPPLQCLFDKFWPVITP